MLNLKYLIIASIQATKIKSELEEAINSLPGKWDIINMDGTLRTVSNANDNFCNITKLAYIKTIKDSHKDNRTYLQVDAMEVYVKYHILKNPNIYIAESNNFLDMEMGFNIDDIVEEFGVSKKNILYKVTL